MPTFQAVLTERRDAGAGLTLVTLTPAREHALAYRAPGQYVEVHAEARGYFALASEVGAPSWELLVRMNGGASDTLLRAPEGTTLDVKGPLGDGFPLERAAGRALVVAVAGSALAVARPIVRDRIARSEARTTSVYVGVRTVRDVPLAQEVAGWAHAGARVVLCLSRPETDQVSPLALAETRRRAGYVQTVLANDVLERQVGDALLFAAGPAAMLDAVRALSREHGATLEVVTNV